MALDLYVGTLTRYYTGGWENVVQAMAREAGTPYVQLGARGGRPPVDEVRPEVLRWQEGLGASWSSPRWREDDEAPYFTDRPGWDGLHALRLQALCLEAGARFPRTVPDDLDEHPLWRARQAAEFAGSRYRQLLAPNLWLPCDVDRVEELTSPAGNPVTVGSSFALLRQLEALNREGHGADAATLARWRVRQPSVGGLLGRWLGGGSRALARYGLAVLLDLCRKAVDHRLPMRTDG